MPVLTLEGKVILTGEIETITGLHIGGAAAGLDIGGIDNPIIRHPLSREPYIPGSSLRGKMRSLLDRHFGKEPNKFIQPREPVVRVHECKEEQEYAACPVCQIFGVAPGEEASRSWAGLMPSRLLVRDVLLAKNHPATDKLRDAKTDLPFTEVKWEAAIDRVTSAAVPRQNERVPAGAVFAPLELIYSIYSFDPSNGQPIGARQDLDRLPVLFKALELVEDDSLGGYGSRGAGKIAFRNLRIEFKSRAYYEGKLTSPLILADALNVSDLRNPEKIQQIREQIHAALGEPREVANGGQG